MKLIIEFAICKCASSFVLGYWCWIYKHLYFNVLVISGLVMGISIFTRPLIFTSMCWLLVKLLLFGKHVYKTIFIGLFLCVA